MIEDFQEYLDYYDEGIIIKAELWSKAIAFLANRGTSIEKWRSLPKWLQEDVWLCSKNTQEDTVYYMIRDKEESDRIRAQSLAVKHWLIQYPELTKGFKDNP